MSDEQMTDMPLRWRTPVRWAAQVMADPLAILNDHAHLEKKAAANALDLIHRFPDGDEHRAYRDRWVKTLAAIAREESEHLSQVVRILHARGGKLSKKHRNAYAADLRKRVRLGDGPRELIDRLMVSALIELRSCERFFVLAEYCGDDELASLYGELYGCELGHFNVYIELARGLPGAADIDDIEARWSQWLDMEAELIRAQPIGSRMHSGVGA